MPLILKLVAKSGQNASFKILFDDTAILGGAVNFVDAMFELNAGNIIKVTFSGTDGNLSMHYKLDENLDIERYEFTNSAVTFVACEKELVQRSFTPTTQKAPDTRPAPE